MVRRVVRDRVAVFRKGRRTVCRSGVDQPVRLGRVEVEDRDAEAIRLHGSRYRVPRSTRVRRVVNLPLVGHEICAVRGERVHEDAEEGLALVELLPREAFIGRLPNGAVGEVEQDRLRLREVAVLHNHLREVVLLSGAACDTPDTLTTTDDALPFSGRASEHFFCTCSSFLTPLARSQVLPGMSR